MTIKKIKNEVKKMMEQANREYWIVLGVVIKTSCPSAYANPAFQHLYEIVGRQKVLRELQDKLNSKEM